MNLIEVKFGETMFRNSLTAYRSAGVSDGKWLYFIAGVHGDEPEGPYFIQRIREWMENAMLIELPIILIPVLNIDGFQARTRTNARHVDLNRVFPCASQRLSPLEMLQQNTMASAKREAESYYLKQLFDRYPPQLVFDIHSTSNAPKMIIQGKDARPVADFLSKYNHYSIIDDDLAVPGSLEAFVADFFMASSILLKIPTCLDDGSMHQMWESNALGVQHLLSGQSI